MTRIESDPPGARIEIDNNSIGITPLYVHIQRQWNPRVQWYEPFTIRAYPVGEGQAIQYKYISSSEETPTNIFFDMKPFRPNSVPPQNAVHDDNRMTRIESDPPGARIEINNNFIGKTPLYVHIQRLFQTGFYESLTIKAYPVTAGQYTQTKYLGFDEATPTSMFFDMNLIPTGNDYNIYINR